MFESEEIGHKIGKARYKRELPKLREALLDAQFDLKQAGKFPVVILISGVDGAGKGETVNLLNEWMDPRLIRTHGFWVPTDEERERPTFYRFWRALPPKGTIGIFFGSWYTAPVVDKVMGRIKTAEVDAQIEQINRFEKMLVDEGVLLLKFWMHLSKEQQQKRLKALHRDPKTRWRVTEQDWENLKRYEKFRRWSEHMLRETSSGEAPWMVVEGWDPEYRSLTVGQNVLNGIRGRLDQKRRGPRPAEAAPLLPPIDGLNILDRLDLGQKVSKKKYESELEEWQGKLNLLFRDRKMKDHAVVAVFEGNDAAGKGGAIRRVTGALDARQFDIVPVAAPTEDERAQPYLWRFWKNIPSRGRLTIFDRSWYGRVLVERVEGFCSEFDYMRAYSEINDFEEQLVGHGIVVVKLWLAISQEEQLARFKARQKVGYKRFKITKEDWRNRDKWEDYRRAVHDMVERTSNDLAPWTLVEANDKYHARVKVLRTVVKQIERVL